MGKNPEHIRPWRRRSPTHKPRQMPIGVGIEGRWAGEGCPVCGKPVCWDTVLGGGLVALDVANRARHCHQPSLRPDRERNREMVASGEQSAGYARWQTKAMG